MKQRSFIFIILAGILWGTSGIFVEFLAPYGFTSLQMTFFRSVVSFISMLIFALVHDRKLLKVKLKDIVMFAFSGLAFFGTASCYYFSMQATSVSTAVVLMYTAPVLVMIFSVAFLGEKLTPLKTISVLCMIVGCGLVSGIIGGLKFDIFGIAIGFLSGISYSAYNIFTKIEMRRGGNPLSATMYCFLFSTVISFFTCKPQTIAGNIAASPAVTLPLIIALGIFTCILPYLLYTIALKNLPAGTASALSIVEPMAATIFSVVLFNEAMSVASIIGIILILGAVYLLSKNEA
ncbi:MAG: EamA family transporter [Clostridia bacterium]|nr:EamA family transporter [Clostridia bacterium]